MTGQAPAHRSTDGRGKPRTGRWLRLPALLTVLAAGIALAATLPATGGATGSQPVALAAKKSCTELRRHLDSLERQLQTNMSAPGGGSARRQHELKTMIKHIEAQLKKQKCPPKHHTTPPKTTPPNTTPTNTTPATEDLCSDEYWVNFDPTEEEMYFYFFLCPPPQGYDRQAHSAASGNPITAVKLVVPGGRAITNTLCPSQLPTGTVSMTTTSNDTLTCSGGSLPVGTHTTMNVQTSPGPSNTMGGQVFAQQDGTFKGPYSIRSGP
jgi:hypothetical protein